MKLKEAESRFNFDTTTSVLVKTEDDELITLSEVNFMGGVCECCSPAGRVDDLEVIRVVDMVTMEVLYESEHEDEKYRIEVYNSDENLVRSKSGHLIETDDCHIIINGSGVLCIDCNKDTVTEFDQEGRIVFSDDIYSFRVYYKNCTLIARRVNDD